TIMFSDLECDYINPIDLCNKLNQFVLPEMLAHAFLNFAFFINGSWIAFAINAPLVAFNVQKISNNRHMYDATEIFRTLGQHKKESGTEIVDGQIKEGHVRRISNCMVVLHSFHMERILIMNIQKDGSSISSV
ncbi:4164_t:CDS:2, partial [Cetraspora pellucida]